MNMFDYIVPEKIVGKTTYNGFKVDGLNFDYFSFNDHKSCRDAPTLQELQRVHFERKADGSPVCPPYHDGLIIEVNTRFGKRRVGAQEATSTFFNGWDNTYVMSPESMEKRGARWYFEGGRVLKIGEDCEQLPSSMVGYATSLSDITGVPVTLGSEEESKERFGEIIEATIPCTNQRILKSCEPRVLCATVDHGKKFTGAGRYHVFFYYEPEGPPDDQLQMRMFGVRAIERLPLDVTIDRDGVREERS